MVYSLFIRMSKKNALVETKRESERNYLLSREIPLQSSSFLDGPSYIYCERERKNRVENGFLIQMFFFRKPNHRLRDARERESESERDFCNEEEHCVRSRGLLWWCAWECAQSDVTAPHGKARAGEPFDCLKISVLNVWEPLWNSSSSKQDLPTMTTQILTSKLLASLEEAFLSQKSTFRKQIQQEFQI